VNRIEVLRAQEVRACHFGIGPSRCTCGHKGAKEDSEDSLHRLAEDANGLHSCVFSFSVRKAITCLRSGMQVRRSLSSRPVPGADLPAPPDGRSRSSFCGVCRPTSSTICRKRLNLVDRSRQFAHHTHMRECDRGIHFILFRHREIVLNGPQGPQHSFLRL
jgi:hypothetical protein